MHDDLVVLAEDALKVDAAVVHDTDGAPVLVLLGTGQTFDNAVAAIRRVVPSLHPSLARAKVRGALPHALPLAPMTYVEQSPVLPDRGPSTPRVTTTMVLAAVVATVVGLGICVVGFGAAMMPRPVASDAVEAVDPRPVVDAAGLRCSPLTVRDLSCTDPAGNVVLVNALVERVTLDWSADRVVVRVFDTSDQAVQYTQQAATRKLTPGVLAVGRYAVWGTDSVQVRRIVARLQGGATPAR